MMPKDVSTFPICYEDADFKLLNGSPLQQQYQLQVEYIKGPYLRLCKFVPGFAERFSMVEWRDFNCIIKSRSYRIENHPMLKESGRGCNVLVPLVDMFNHSINP